MNIKINSQANTYHLLPLKHHCQCGNQVLVNYGESCDVCMGGFNLEANLEGLLPEEKFDDSYFEELESYYEMQETIDSAA